MNKHRSNLSAIVDSNLLDLVREKLNSLLDKDESNNSEEDTKYYRYKITAFKKISQSDSPTDIKMRTKDFEYIKDIYIDIKHILPKLNLSEDGIRYFAYSAIKSKVFQLKRRSTPNKYLHIIAFITDQYRSLQDNLADVFLTTVQTQNNIITREHKNWCYENYNNQKKLTESLLSSNVFIFYEQIRGIVENKVSSDSDKVSSIKALLAKEAQTVADHSSLKVSLNEMQSNKELYGIWESRSIQMQNRLSAILKVLDFRGEDSNSTIMAAIKYFKIHNGVISDDAPLEFMDNDQQAVIFADKKIRNSLYKVFYLYIQPIA